MLLFFYFLRFLLIFQVNSINVLVYSPAFAASHTNFMARLADTLTEAGHNVTFLVPIVDVARTKQLGVHVTTDVIIVEKDEHTTQESVPFDDSMEAYWTEETHSSNVGESFQWFFDGMKLGCENLLRRHEILDQLKSRNFDVAIVEPLSVCGLGLAKKLEIGKTILASSCAYYDYLFRHIGEPDVHSYLPSLMSTTGDVMTTFERLENHRVAEAMATAMYKMFDSEKAIYRKHFGDEIPDWRDLLPAASLYFTNSNPYLDFPRPILQKTVSIGGISVDTKKIKSQELDKEWNHILNKRNLNMLISFGSMIHSSHMLDDAKKNLIKVIKSEPNVTFIWKYETNDTSFAFGIDNIYFSKWVPQSKLLNDARLTAFLTHGGLGSTNELAHFGKPAVMVPIFGDQYRNGHMLQRHGCAIIVQKTELSNWKIVSSAVKSVLYDENYKKNAAHLADLLQNQPVKPKEIVVKYVEFVARFGPFPEMDAYGRQLNFIQRNLLDVYLIELFGHFLFFLIIFCLIPLQLKRWLIKRT
ncbi:UDP-glucuronosyltransferase [Caenorhabditis elegans]|uniref:UDP-glucuronosyltransferase n=1 Tax=Caenorhabditis elegans TaxID=6239 RepID=P91037_CAEEL|nr:UDP-glucuronosyltransferase [Caenorhabditis elegans]CCD64217.1 UDP-glucuronosyltransferase [Caenorhabditis elegans]|eukprot:NP_491436.1 UDP-glucuronosyltransferase [Caenorhabditis elegans]